MKIALCGAHRSGKTTLAKAFAAARGIEFLDMSTMSVVKQCGYDISKPLSPEARCTLQTRLLSHYNHLYDTPGDWIADRSPFDLVAYAMIEYPADMWATNYADLCSKLVSQLTHVCFIPSALQYMDAKGKAAQSTALKTELLIRGCLSKYMDNAAIPCLYLNTNALSIEDRIAALSNLVQLYSMKEGV